MIQITIDEDLRKKFFSSGQVVELCDASGKLLGRLYPVKVDPLDGWAPITPVPTEDELREAAKYDGPGMTTDELLAYLKRDREGRAGEEMIHAKSPRRKGNGSLSSWMGSWRDNRPMLVILLVFFVPFMVMSLAGVSVGWLMAWCLFAIPASVAFSSHLDATSDQALPKLPPH